MKILFVAENLLSGGRETRFIDLANELSKKNFDVSLLLYGNVFQVEEKLHESIKVIHKVVDSNTKNWVQRNIFYRLKCLSLINEILKDSDYEVVLSFDDMVNINLLLSRYARKKKVVISERGDPNYNKKYLKIIKRILFKKAEGVVFQTEGARDFFKQSSLKMTTVIPNPIPHSDYGKYIFKGKREKVIVSVARLWLYQKRQDVLLKGFKLFSEEFPEYSLVLYGDGPDWAKIIELIEKLELEEKVVLAGKKNDILYRIRDASFFVLTSDFEGIPNALIEAMTVGLPVISTDCSPGGARFLIDNKANGLLIERNNPWELYSAMKYFALNPSHAGQMGEEATSVVKRFDREQIYNQWEEFLTCL